MRTESMKTDCRKDFVFLDFFSWNVDEDDDGVDECDDEEV